eukprot:COSAG02_NODE_62960_length_264_cov_0.939394_1_plen_21_part_10
MFLSVSFGLPHTTLVYCVDLR